MALAFLVPVLNGLGGYALVVWMGLLQALALLLTSHAVADRRYEIAFDVAILKRLFAFGWPIWLSAFPLIAVYQGDRMVIGKLLGMEAIAAYAACFMIAMVPGLIAAKVGNALMLPLFSRVIENPKAFASRFRAMTDATTLGAALYLANVTIAGGDIVRVTFGPNYSGYGPLAATLALMWSIRLLQAVPGMALLAHGETRPFLVAGLLRASAILPVIALAAAGYGLVAIAAAGVAGEIASLIYVTWRVARLGERSGRGLGVTFLSRSAMLAPALTVSTAVVRSMPANGGLTMVAVAVMALSCIIVVAACLLSPHLRGLLAHARTKARLSCRPRLQLFDTCRRKLRANGPASRCRSASASSKSEVRSTNRRPRNWPRSQPSIHDYFL